MGINKIRLEHAEHNYSTCTFLIEGETFNDWVITVAFYSALHFVRFKIFPIEFKNSEDPFKHFDTYCSEYNIRDKHNEMEYLVKKFLPEIYLKFRELKNDCWTCRYNNFKVSKKRAANAYELISSIKEYCKDKKNNLKLDSSEEVERYN